MVAWDDYECVQVHMFMWQVLNSNIIHLVVVGESTYSIRTSRDMGTILINNLQSRIFLHTCLLRQYWLHLSALSVYS